MTQLIDKATIVATLEKARDLIAGGCFLAFSTDASGAPCAAFDEMVERYSPSDALLVAAAGDTFVVQAVEDVLERHIHASGDRFPLRFWVLLPKVTVADVLRLFHRATAHLRAET